MKRNMIVLLVSGAIAAMVLAVSGADASTRGIPWRVANCTSSWSPLGFKGKALTLRGQVKCNRPMLAISGHALLLRMKLDGTEQWGSPSPQASAHSDFFLVRSAYYQFQLSHVCRPSAVSYKWWFTIYTTVQHKSWSKPQRYQWFSNTVITDCA